MPAAPRLREHLDALARHCEDVDRNPAEIVVSEQTCVVLGRDDSAYREKLALAGAIVAAGSISTRWRWVEHRSASPRSCARRCETGDEFTIVFGDLGMQDTLELFRERVLPLLACDA